MMSDSFAQFVRYSSTNSRVRISVTKQPYHTSKCLRNNREPVKRPITDNNKLAANVRVENTKNSVEEPRSPGITVRIYTAIRPAGMISEIYMVFSKPMSRFSPFTYSLSEQRSARSRHLSGLLERVNGERRNLLLYRSKIMRSNQRTIAINLRVIGFLDHCESIELTMVSDCATHGVPCRHLLLLPVALRSYR